MNILMLSWEYPPRVIGGVAPHVRDLARALVARGHEVTVVTGDHPEVAPLGEDRGVDVRRVTDHLPQPPDFPGEVLQFNLALLQETLKMAAEGRFFDLVHCHDWLVAPAGRMLKHLWVRPLVATIHATEYGRNGGLHNELQHYINGMEWWLGYEAWRVITCSRYMNDEVRRVFQLPADKVNVVPNGVSRSELELPRADLTRIRRLRQPGGLLHHPIIAFMGRLVWEKGAQDLIEAMPEIRTRVPGTRLIIAGEGPIKGQLMGKVTAMGLHDAVYFPGFVSGLGRNRLLALADVAVFPSRYEPFGIVCLEAMAAGVPVVVGDTGGLAEVIRQGVNGLKVTPADPAAIARAVVAVLSSPQMTQRLVAEAARDIDNKYDWHAIAGQTAAVYRQVLEAYERSGWALQERRVAGGDAGRIPIPLRLLAARKGLSSRYRLTDQEHELRAPSPAR